MLTATLVVFLLGQAASEERHVIDRRAFLYSLANAKAGSAVAQFQTAEGYRVGRGVGRDKDQAIYWYGKAAEQGLVRAQTALAEMLNLTPGNAAESGYFFRRSAEQGDYQAQASLADIYSSKQLPGAIEEAYMWASLAETSVHTEILRDIGLSDRVQQEFLDTRKKIQAKMTPQQVARAKRTTRAWIKPFNRRMVVQGDAAAARAAQSRDQERRMNYGKAAELYIKAADLGDLRAQLNLAKLYSSGQLTPNPKKAHAWASIAATLARRPVLVEQGLPADFRSECVSLRDKIAGEMDARALGAASAGARKWIEEYNRREK